MRLKIHNFDFLNRIAAVLRFFRQHSLGQCNRTAGRCVDINIQLHGRTAHGFGNRPVCSLIHSAKNFAYAFKRMLVFSAYFQLFQGFFVLRIKQNIGNIHSYRKSYPGIVAMSCNNFCANRGRRFIFRPTAHSKFRCFFFGLTGLQKFILGQNAGLSENIELVFCV